MVKTTVAFTLPPTTCAGDHRNVSTLFAHFEAAAAAKHEHLMQMHAAAIIQSIRLHSQVRWLMSSEGQGSSHTTWPQGWWASQLHAGRETG